MQSLGACVAGVEGQYRIKGLPFDHILTVWLDREHKCFFGMGLLSRCAKYLTSTGPSTATALLKVKLSPSEEAMPTTVLLPRPNLRAATAEESKTQRVCFNSCAVPQSAADSRAAAGQRAANTALGTWPLSAPAALSKSLSMCSCTLAGSLVPSTASSSSSLMK